jgi:hypothetical protein
LRNNLAPIVIFCFKRADLLKKLIKSIKKNPEHKYSPIIFFSDNYKYEKDKNEVLKVRNLIEKKIFFKKKIIYFREKNYGLKKNILNGVQLILKKYKKIIVLEDDLEISKNFIRTMNYFLTKYSKNKKIYSITGYSFGEEKNKIEENFFLLKRPSSWGWATWQKKWKNLQKKNSIKKINGKYGNDLVIMNIKKNKKKLKSWAFDWSINHIYKDRFCIYPKHSMVKNNGFDDFATNNLFKSKKFLANFKNLRIKKYSVANENSKIINLCKKNYDIKKIIFFLKLIYFKIF